MSKIARMSRSRLSPALVGGLTGAILLLFASFTSAAEASPSATQSEDEITNTERKAERASEGEGKGEGEGKAERASEGEGEKEPRSAPDESEPPSPKNKLRVVVAGSPPFVVDSMGKPAGPSISVWHSVASHIGIGYDLSAAEDADEAIRLVEEGEADVAIGPLSITADRAREVAFSQPYFQTTLAIGFPAEESVLKRLAPFLSLAFLTALGGLMLILGIVGSLVWLAERKKNPEEFPNKPLAGVGNGIWFALVTMTTVGYGDRSPKTLAGRIVAGGWMLIALITVSSLTAGIATALTVFQLGTHSVKDASELRSKRVATVEGTAAEEFVLAHGGRLVIVEDVPAAIDAIDAGQADAVVFDRPALASELSHRPESDVVLSPDRHKPQGYGFAVSHDSKLREKIDVALLTNHQSFQSLFANLQ